MADIKFYIADYWESIKKYTPARVALGRAGGSLNTNEQLKLFQAHAMARDAVHAKMDNDRLKMDLGFLGTPFLDFFTKAIDREEFLLRPDNGRVLKEIPSDKLPNKDSFDVCLIVGDGLSATAIHKHVPSLFKILIPKLSHYQLAPICLVQQARVAVSDPIGELLNAKLSVIFIGERPGLSSPDSLGIYLTYDPKSGLTDEKRNCISNVKPGGMHYEVAAEKLVYLIDQSIRKKISGVKLKDDLQIKLKG